MLGYPRRIRRGLIEAASDSTDADASLAYPRRIRRGLIEAYEVSVKGERWMHIRDEFVAASLKQVTDIQAVPPGVISATNSSRPH